LDISLHIIIFYDLEAAKLFGFCWMHLFIC